jgi:ATP-dependent HslUV protease subunit HslV
MKIRGTTILAVRRNNRVAIGGDGQVTMDTAIIKSDSVKIRPLLDGKVLCGFAGSGADAFALLERFDSKLKDYPENITRAATELAKEWRMDRALRHLQALMIVVDRQHILLISGTGDVIQPTDGVLAIGSGGTFALAAARALLAHTEMDAGQIVAAALKIASDIDIYTNSNVVIKEMECSL